MRDRDMSWLLLPATDLEKFESQWNQLAFSVGAGHPLLLSQFLVPLIQGYAVGRTKLAIRQARGNDGWHTAGIVDQLSWGRVNTFCPSQLPMCPMLLGDVNGRDSIAALSSTAMMLSLLRVDSKYQTVLGVNHNWKAAKYGTTMAISCDRLSFQEYWDGRPKSLRKNLRRYRNRAEARFRDVRHMVYSNQREIRAATERYAEIESKGWKARAGTALEPSSRQTEFYVACLEKFAEMGGASIHELRLGDHVVASRLCIESNGIFVILKTTYDEEYAEFAPGRLLLYELLRSVFSTGRIRVVEFYTKADDNQLAWATERREIVDISIYRYKIIARAAFLKQRMRPQPT